MEEESDIDKGEEEGEGVAERGGEGTGIWEVCVGAVAEGAEREESEVEGEASGELETHAGADDEM